MNLQKIIELRDHLVNNVGQENFNMRHWLIIEGDSSSTHKCQDIPTIQEFKSHSCGTAACLAGHALIANNTHENLYKNLKRAIPYAAANILDLSEAEREYVFLGKWFNITEYLESGHCRASNAHVLLSKIDKTDSFWLELIDDILSDTLSVIQVSEAIAYLNTVIETGDIFVTVSPSKNCHEIDEVLEIY